MDTETMKLLQQMLHVGSGELTSGSTKEDFLEVVCAWQIKNPAQWVLLLEAREQITVKLQSPTVAGAAIAGETVEDDEFDGSDEDDILVSRISGKVDVEKVRAHRIGLAYDRGQPVPTWLEECKQRWQDKLRIANGDAAAPEGKSSESTPGPNTLLGFGKYRCNTFEQVRTTQSWHCRWVLDQTDPGPRMLPFQTYLRQVDTNTSETTNHPGSHSGEGLSPGRPVSLVSAASTVESKIADEKAGVEDRPTDPIDRPIDRPTDLTDGFDRPTDGFDRPTDRPTDQPTRLVLYASRCAEA